MRPYWLILTMSNQSVKEFFRFSQALVCEIRYGQPASLGRRHSPGKVPRGKRLTFCCNRSDFMETTHSGRVSGLDLLRALAILLVLLAHYPKTGGGLFTRALNLGWTGVDLFFVLSGYLIAGQLFKSLAEGEQIGYGNFYLRRLLRTLPSYYAIL